jgi:VWFA-related protein
LIALSLSCTALLAMGQQPASEAATNRISLDVTVSSKNDASVGGLTANDFKVLDNKGPQTITSFREVDGPGAMTQVILVMDAVNLPYERLSYERQQIAQFFSADDGHVMQPMTTAVLMDNGMHIQPNFTTDGNTLRSSLDGFTIGLRNITRSAGFYGGVERYQLSLKALHMLVDYVAPKPGRKLILWISPGWPLLSGPEVNLTTAQRDSIFADIVALSAEMRDSHVRLDAVNPIGTAENMSETIYYENFLKGVRSARDAQIGDLGLQVIALQSGGIVLNSSNDIVGMLKHCVEQTKTIYEISFDASPGERPNDFHQIQVQVTRPGLVAHANTGYYAHATYSANDAGSAVAPVK